MILLEVCVWGGVIIGFLSYLVFGFVGRVGEMDGVYCLVLMMFTNSGLREVLFIRKLFILGWFVSFL